jgi:hypothetical protein
MFQPSACWKVLANVNNVTEVSKDDLSDRSKHTQSPKKVVIRGRSTRSQDNPKRNAARPDKDDASPFLTAYLVIFLIWLDWSFYAHCIAAQQKPGSTRRVVFVPVSIPHKSQQPSKPKGMLFLPKMMKLPGPNVRHYGSHCFVRAVWSISVLLDTWFGM